MVTKAAKRIRRSPEASKLAILEAAERRLIEDGPDGVRVQRIAADLGMTDAAVHYHFGNREALIDALMRFSAKRLVDDIGAAMETWDADRLDLHRLGAVFRKAYTERGVARLVLSVLAGRKPRGAGMLRRLVEAVHEARERRAKARGQKPPPLADTQFIIVLLSGTHLLMPIAGEALLLSADAAADKAGMQQYLDWVAALLGARLGSDPIQD
ncbi:MAG TPA: helix-turn-helix domain-containing protein [Xanthobacteraceae bacterium]